MTQPKPRASHPHWDFCSRSLVEVSRTFAIPIRMLPSDLERAVTCGYLLCRIADTIEDTAGLSEEARDELFEAFLLVVERQHASTFAAVFARRVRVDPNDPEHRLALGLGRVLSVVRTLSARAQHTLRRWVTEMTRGMMVYSHRDAGPDALIAVHDVKDLERYCYFVAGTVGHLLTDLFLDGDECTGSSIVDPETERTLRRHAEAFGLGLQLTNILKDITDDYARGVCYVPRELASASRLSLDELLLPSRRELAHQTVAPLFTRAWEHLDGALAYALAIPEDERALRLFCLVPLFLAAETLRETERNDAQFDPTRQVKITREEVARVIALCSDHAADDSRLEASFPRRRYPSTHVAPTLVQAGAR